ncbi:hypothetical protein DPMN_164697 [Dreissena polymorpha]|uniref:NACHT domain-containing protein n=1 Tax=Dreissena polymorpha TaxID=45954 RepID=A0A9D4ITY1_DREPO|nr:hypothetical protein DPMN_164697 [Dreissena polymorpha]
MCKDNGTFTKTNRSVTQYKDVFLTDGKVNQRIFLQGEVGSGKTTFAAMMALDWCGKAPCEPHIFTDVNVLQEFTFVFHIALRNSFECYDVTEMIKDQIINCIYSSKEDRKKAYKLLNEIMTRERCLALLDGLDEWTSPDSHHNIPTLVEKHSSCVMLITTRPWKLAAGYVKHSEIDRLLKLKGIQNSFDFAKRVLSCMVEEDELQQKYWAFEKYIWDQNLEKLMSSPLMLSVIVCSYAEGTELKGSKCEIYSMLLDVLLKKATSEKKYIQQPRVSCFKETQYIQPNLAKVNHIAEAAFRLMFSDKRENALVFGAKDLDALVDDEERVFALKTGILTESESSSSVRALSTFSFRHKSIQEFLSAYHIACNEHVINTTISGYLNRHDTLYRDISQVFLFLCGMRISAANALSYVMDACENYALIENYIETYHQDCICDGYKEAVANKQTGINLTLSHFKIYRYDEDLEQLWVMNQSKVISLVVKTTLHHSSYYEKYPSKIVVDLSSCHKMKSLTVICDETDLEGKICFFYQ